MNNCTMTDKLRAKAVSALKASSNDCAYLDSDLILSGVLGINRSDLLSGRIVEISEEDKSLFLDGVNRRIKGEPVAYITGYKEFYEKRFKVTPDTLIPRPETELLVDKAYEAAVGKKGAINILDIGTGCGNIAVSLACLLARPNCFFYATDISPLALETAKQNAGIHGQRGRVEFLASDVFNGFHSGELFDIIVSNPPYIPAFEYGGLSAEVKSEPYSALIAGTRGTEIIERIIAESPNHLKPRGVIILEIGYNQSAEAGRMLKQGGYTEIGFIKDLNGLPRAAFASKG